MKFCDECNHFTVMSRYGFVYGRCHFMEKKLGIIRSIGLIEQEGLANIPDWCPLEDAEKDYKNEGP